MEWVCSWAMVVLIGHDDDCECVVDEKTGVTRLFVGFRADTGGLCLCLGDGVWC